MIPFFAFLALQQPAPSTAYWQQRVVYEINARLDEPSQTLRGDERVRYINHSPDTLRTIAFHLYLNAFRPGSRWSDADSAEGQRQFNDLKDPNFGFNHVRNVMIDGQAVVAIWPLGRDSTIARFTLPRALAPGDSLTVTMDWDARPSIPPRRQGRRGRSYDFAQWYPKVVVYDKYGWEEHALYPAGEFYGEFGDFFVKLDVPRDQVVGATGEPVCGDPGWRTANRVPGRVVQQTTDSAGRGQTCSLTGSGLTSIDNPAPDSNRKQILWVARDVHNFAMTMSPDYRYEGGEWNGIQVHVLYQPGDDSTWGGGIVVNNTINTLKWLNVLFGRYPWPQMTVAHRIEGGGSESPMMQMNGSPSQGLNLHEGGHSYLMGILANNEWREGWMDEGFTSFQTSWREEVEVRNDAAVRNLEARVLLDDLDDASEPVSTVSDKFRDFTTYNNMIYNRGELFLQELRRMVGNDVMVEILRRYYQRWKLHHVDEDAFRTVAEEVTHRDLKTFFAQWLHAVVLTDYAIGSAERMATAAGWQTTVNVVRRAAGVFPITVAVYAEHDTAYAAASGEGQTEQVTIATRSKPRRVVLDPLVIAHDWNMLNNQFTFTGLPRLGREMPVRRYFDTWFSPQFSRDHLTLGFMPTLWYNDAAGATLGLHLRSDYLGRFEQNTTSVFCGVRHRGTSAADCGFSATLGNPTSARSPNVSQHFHAFRLEGRAGAGLDVERIHTPHAGFGPTYVTGASANWTATYDMAFLPPTLWDNGGSFEAALWLGVSDTRGHWTLSANAKAAGGVMYRSPGGGFTTRDRYDAQPYLRPELTATASRPLGRRATLGVRGYAAGAFSADPVLSQRRIFLAGADPYQTISNPLVRSVGAPLLRDDCWCRWQTPGDGNLRGYHQSLSADRLVSVNVELERTLAQSRRSRVTRVALALFADGGYVGNATGIGGTGDGGALAAPDHLLADAGIGIRLAPRIGRTTWTARLDFPVYVSDPQQAFAHRLTALGFNRLVVSFSPVIP